MSEVKTKITADVYPIGTPVWFINEKRKIALAPVHSIKISIEKCVGVGESNQLVVTTLFVKIPEAEYTFEIVNMKDAFLTREELIESLNTTEQ